MRNQKKRTFYLSSFYAEFGIYYKTVTQFFPRNIWEGFMKSDDFSLRLGRVISIWPNLIFVGRQTLKDVKYYTRAPKIPVKLNWYSRVLNSRRLTFNLGKFQKYWFEICIWVLFAKTSLRAIVLNDNQDLFAAVEFFFDRTALDQYWNVAI